VVRICDVAAKDVRADQSTHVARAHVNVAENSKLFCVPVKMVVAIPLQVRAGLRTADQNARAMPLQRKSPPRVCLRRVGSKQSAL
jgi:hypothetical protein